MSKAKKLELGEMNQVRDTGLGSKNPPGLATSTLEIRVCIYIYTYVCVCH